MTTRWPIPAAVAPPPTTLGSTIATRRPACAHSRAQAQPTMPAPRIITSNVLTAPCIKTQPPPEVDRMDERAGLTPQESRRGLGLWCGDRHGTRAAGAIDPAVRPLQGQVRLRRPPRLALRQYGNQ